MDPVWLGESGLSGFDKWPSDSAGWVNLRFTHDADSALPAPPTIRFVSGISIASSMSWHALRQAFCEHESFGLGI